MVRPDLAAIYHRVSRPGLKKFNQSLPHVQLLNPVEEVEEAAGVDKGDLAAQCVQLLVLGIQHVACNKRRTEQVSILKEVVADVDKLGLQVCAN